MDCTGTPFLMSLRVERIAMAADYLVTKGSRAMILARLMALLSLRWWNEQTPLLLRETILE